MNYNSLYDIYFQKVNDCEFVYLNRDLFPTNNLVKLFSENKHYYLNFTLDHLIKLDTNFLDANVIFTDENGTNYILNKNNKIIKDLKGNNIKLTTNKKALLYFYYRIENYTEKGTIVLDKSTKGKNIKFEIKNSKSILIKDICFKGYYPMLTNKSWQTINNNEVYVENIIDNLEYDLYEGENYIIYIFDSYDENNLPILIDNEISNIVYYDNLLTPGNKYNFEVISKNSNSNIILNSFNKRSVIYQFIRCKDDVSDITFRLEYSKGTYQRIIRHYSDFSSDDILAESLNKEEILVHSFQSYREFLFFYSFQNEKEPSYEEVYDYKPSIKYLEEISKNIVRIKFQPDYRNLRKYYIVIAKKDEVNNNKTFSDACHLAKLMTSNSKSIIVKTIYEKTNHEVIITDINITDLNVKENEEIVISIVSQIISNKKYEFYSPSEYRIILRESKEAIADISYYIGFGINLFKFEYNHRDDIDQLIIFKLSELKTVLLVFNEINQIEYEVHEFNDELALPLKKSGTYYFDFYAVNSDISFKYYISGKIIDTIDLTKNLYYKKSANVFKIKPNPEIIKVNNLKKDTDVFFTHTIINDDSEYGSPFTICNSKNECVNKVITYKFLKGMNYTIYINFVKQSMNFYAYSSFFFFPIRENTIEEKEPGYYYISDPKIYITNIENKEEIHCMIVNGEKMYSSSTNNISLQYLQSIRYTTSRDIQQIYNGYYPKNKYGIVVSIPSFNENPTRVIIVDNYYIASVSGDDTFSAKTNRLIDFGYKYVPSENVINRINFYNKLTTLISPTNNLRIITTIEQGEKSIIGLNNHNDYFYTLYIEKYDKQINVILKHYLPKYSVFGIMNDFFYSKATNSLSTITGLSEIKYLESLRSLNVQIDTNINDINDYFNFFIYEFTKKINIYIKKIYGNIEIYEDETNYLDLRDFSDLSVPMKSLKGKRSLFNRVHTLNNNRSIVGHLSHDSLFDLYVEIDDENNT